ncbi:MAG: hypothetical protein MJ082_03785, partial [Clostridia bacterium]|nr:hypothetical protein [Clostridia bacterium]
NGHLLFLYQRTASRGSFFRFEDLFPFTKCEISYYTVKKPVFTPQSKNSLFLKLSLLFFDQNKT